MTYILGVIYPYRNFRTLIVYLLINELNLQFCLFGVVGKGTVFKALLIDCYKETVVTVLDGVQRF